MPFYEYQCKACGEVFELLQRSSADQEDVTCILCGVKDCERILSTASVHGVPSPRGSSGSCAPRSGFS